MKKIYRAAKYIRTSSLDSETEYGDSIANQRRLIDAFISLHPDITVICERVDDGYSGLTAERPAFKNLLKEIEDGTVNCVIVRDLSRLSRDYIQACQYLRDFFPVHGVRFIAVDDNIDSILLDGFEMAIALLKSIFSEQYVRDVSVKTRSALDTKRRQGQYVGAIPIYGYLKSVDNKNQLIPDPDTFSIVQSIFQMKLKGMSAAKIATALNNAYIPSPLAYKQSLGISYPTSGFADKQNASWSITTILRILRDENYTGTLVQGRQRRISYKAETLTKMAEAEWIKIENAHTPIISHSDYEAVQRLWATDTRIPPGYDEVHIFSGVLICSSCGGSMIRKKTIYKDKCYVNYICSTGRKKGCTSPASISEKVLTQHVTAKIMEHIVCIKSLRTHSSAIQSLKAIRADISKQISDCCEKIYAVENFKLYLHKSKENGFINDAELQSLSGFYDIEITRKNAELSIMRDKLRNIESVCGDNQEWIQSCLQFADIKDLDRFTVIKMIRCIHINAEKEVIIDFVYQSEYEQLKRCAMLGGGTDGT